MPNTLDIKPSTISLQLDRGAKHKELLTVKKTTGGLVGYAGEPEPVEYREWVTIQADSLALDPPTVPSTKVELTITVPANADYKQHRFRVEFVDENDKTDVNAVDIQVDVPKPWLQQYWWVIVALLAILAIVLIILERSTLNPTS